jgi:ribosome maturation factor RimP
MAQAPLDMDERFIRETGLAAEIAAIAVPVLEDLGFELVRVRITSQDGATVQVMIERKGGIVSIDDCTGVSRRLSPLLDAHDPMPGGYNLEVSSPGMARPLVRPRDFVSFAGHQARIELKELVDGRRRFKGEIEGFNDGEVRLKVDLEGFEGPQIIGLAVDLIDEARLVIDDSALKQALKGKPAAAGGA